ncbi:MAG: polysaccharide lyase family 7 protein [Nannocystaceae bacterium]|nr:polysaccharide lyase family 7 protein [Nannocystaceae bacterium]
MAPEPADGIEIGERWSYEIRAEGHELTVTVIREDGEALSATHMMSEYYDDAWLYFKAGVYNQNSGGEEDDGVRATFFALTHEHDQP